LDNVLFSINDISFATIIESDKNICKIKANGKNKLGQFTLIASVNGNTYEKTIEVVPLW